MSTWRPKKCKVCKITAASGVSISKNGYCFACGVDVYLDAIKSMSAGAGPAFEQWKKSPGPRGRPRRTKGVGGTP